MNTTYINDALRILRKSQDITLSQLAVKLDVSTSYISKIENASKTPNLELILKYADAFKIKPSVIISLAESLEKDKSLKASLGKSIVKLMAKIEQWGELE